MSVVEARVARIFRPTLISERFDEVSMIFGVNNTRLEQKDNHAEWQAGDSFFAATMGFSKSRH